MSKNKSEQKRGIENWQAKRNYQRLRDQNGQVIANIITVEGVDVEVTEEIFLVYSQMDRRERYLSEDTAAGRMLSLEQMAKDEILPYYVGAEVIPDVEDTYLEREESERVQNLLRQLPEAIAAIDVSERRLVDALYIKGISAREYGRIIGVSDMAIRKRRNRILKKLEKILLK